MAAIIMAFQRSVACLLVLPILFMMEVPTHSAARSMTVGDMEVAHVQGDSFAIGMLPYYNVNSPYATSNLTLEQRVQIAVKSSLGRGQYIHNLVHGEAFRSADNAVYTSPLYVHGIYVMQIRLGTPARTFVVIADTGSDLVWLQCATCGRCFTQPDPIFNPAESSTYKPIPCEETKFCSARALGQPLDCTFAGTCIYTYEYGGYTVTNGDLASETLTLTTTSGATEAIPQFAFGCGHNNLGGGIERLNVDGLVGLGQGALSLVEQIGPRIGNVFSYCLVDFDNATNKTSALLLGSPGPVALQYTPLLANAGNPTFYYVNLVGITINGVALKYPAAVFQIGIAGGGGVVLDSGTPISRLNGVAYKPFHDQLQSLISYPQVGEPTGSSLDPCYNVAGIANPVFPKVAFQFENINLELPADNVFLKVDSNVVCLAFLSSPDVSIFGSIQQQNFQVAYDRANKRVGFAPKTC